MPQLTRAGVACLLFIATALVAFAHDVNPFVALLPSLKTLGAPAGTVEGLRVSFYSSAATIPGVYHSYHLDEEGNWIDEKGNRYRREDEPGSGGHGYTQVDLVALDGRTATLSVTSWGLQQIGMTQAVIPLGGGCFVSETPAAGGDYWLHPQALKEAPTKSGHGVTIVNMPYKIGGKNFQAVRFQYEKPNSRMVYVYDRESGLLLHSNSMVKNDTRTMLTQNTLVDAREVKWPWAKSATPAWLAGLTRLQGTGQQIVAAPYSPQMALPVQVAIKVLTRGKNWVKYEQTACLQTPGSLPDTRTLASGPAQCGGLWLPPAGLAGLKTGQVLDTDKVTGITTRVANAAATVDGKAAVILAEAGAAHSTAWAYEKTTGKLIHFMQTINPLNSTLDIALR